MDDEGWTTSPGYLADFREEQDGTVTDPNGTVHSWRRWRFAMAGKEEERYVDCGAADQPANAPFPPAGWILGDQFVTCLDCLAGGELA